MPAVHARPARVTALARGAVLLLWEDASAAAGPVRVLADAGPIRPPYARTSLELAAGGLRHLLALRPGATGPLRVVDGEGAPVAAAPPLMGEPSPLEPTALLDGLTTAARPRLVRFLLELAPGLLGLRRDPGYARLLAELLAELAPQPAVLAPRCRLPDGTIFLEGSVPAALGAPWTAARLDPRGLESLTVPVPAEEPTRGRLPLRLLLPPAAAGVGATLVLLGPGGVACRRIRPAAARPPEALAWLGAEAASGAAARRWLLDRLAERGRSDEAARALLRELRVLRPPPAARPPRPDLPLGAGLDLVLGTTAGVLLAGWLSDPFGVVIGLRVERGGTSALLPIEQLDRFAHPTLDRTGEAEPGEPPPRRGFAAFLADPTGLPAEAICRVTLRLGSGAELPVGEGPSLLPWAEARRALLAAVPEGSAPPGLLARALAPALAALDAARPPAPVGTCSIGVPPEAPRLALLMPVGDDPDVLRCRMGAFAADPGLAGVELIHVLERPGRAEALERLLAGLHAVHGLPCRLVVLDGPQGAGACLAAAASVATAPLLVVLGPGVVPERAGWLAPLEGLLAARPAAALAGARIVRADDSVAHAGGEPVVDAAGRLELAVPLRGFPRGWRASWAARRVRLVPEGCMALRRDFLDAQGGFPTGYATLELLAAELALAAEAAGREAWVVRAPTMVDLAPQPGAGDHARELDRLRLEARWAERLRAARLPQDGAGPPEGRLTTLTAGRRRLGRAA